VRDRDSGRTAPLHAACGRPIDKREEISLRRTEFEKAASLAGNSREREVLLARAAALGPVGRE
jgi:hypothetical protein